jgi:hypothetical protein
MTNLTEIIEDCKYVIIAQTGGYVEVREYRESENLEEQLDDYNQNSLTKKWIWEIYLTFEEAKDASFEIQGTF